ncbi:hypothetical protein U14_04620 [Candidatus Moduliflexus flocculans]|uniref:Ice-binding protein C-terminal domain-containing protein n=1 Tax=Candidatus Moduliflexus flocculans TaxID=1499966 RepID=A0A0S6W4E6_9BACT|nr:hypothetical protein U14_04620 [Candidatus Moduliflexus flocculans]
MKKFTLLFLITMFAIGLAGSAEALSYTFEPNDGSGDPNDLNDLDHYYNYTWGFNWAVPTGERIVGASLVFDNICNWDNNTNDLYVHLLDDTDLGVKSYYDGQADGDNFDGMGILLHHWHNLSTIPQDIVYTFDAAELATLTTFAANGLLGLAFDADCHYWNDGITLKIETEKVVVPPSTVPEPGTLFLIGSGFVVLVVSARKRMHK